MGAQRPVVHATRNVWLEFIYLGVSLVGSGLLMKWAFSQFDPTRANKKAASLQKAMLRKRLGKSIDPDYHELMIACDVVNPDHIDVSLSDVGGLEETKISLNNRVIQPIKQPRLFNSYLLRQSKGVLLYGPPGTGKTMLAKALAKEAGATFINLTASSLQCKWFGETQKLIHAVFSLAYKLQPCIIFIDEVESLLGKRNSQEHEATTTMKTEFMQLWDGFSSDAGANVMVLAATNRPFDLDDAVLRRFRLQLEVGMPNVKQRETILQIILRKHATEGSNREGGLNISRELIDNLPGEDKRRPLAKIAEETANFSGSDLMELCSRAAALTVQDHLDSLASSTSQPSRSTTSRSTLQRLAGDRRRRPDVRALSSRDFTEVLKTFRPSTYQADTYRAQTVHREHRGSDSSEFWAQLINVLAAQNQQQQTSQ